MTDHDGTERLSADDMATAREAQFLAASLARQAQVGAVRVATPGVCANCGEACAAPLAVYCDPACRTEHEVRLTLQRRQGAIRGRSRGA